MLNIKQRQVMLKDLGYYNGAIDGSEGNQTKQAYLKLQTDYFTRQSDRDGKYGTNTDNLLQSVWNCRDLKHFKIQEFKCQCNGKYCTGYPAVINYDLVHYLDNLREQLGKPMTITSGLRCTKHNSAVGGALLSRHKSGKAIDFSSSYCNNSLNKRKEVINNWISNYPYSRYGYCHSYYNDNGKVGTVSYPSMGSVVHLDVE